MILKIGRTTERRLEFVSKKYNKPMDVLVAKIIAGFFGRFEEDYGKIELKDAPKKMNLIWAMYKSFQEKFHAITGEHYEADERQKKIDMRNLRLIRDKMVFRLISSDKEILAVNELDLLAGFDALIEKAPNWWKSNSFTIQTIYKHFDEILMQIKKGTEGKKDRLDSFISELSEELT